MMEVNLRQRLTGSNWDLKEMGLGEKERSPEPGKDKSSSIQEAFLELSWRCPAQQASSAQLMRELTPTRSISL